MIINIKRLDKHLPVPKHAHRGDAGCDLYSAIEKEILPNKRVLIPTGIAVSIPEGYAAFVQPRSGLAVKYGISIVNTPGLIDSHYRGEIKVILINTDSKNSFTINKGDKIAQMVFQKVEEIEFKEVVELDRTERGTSGFGSTGINQNTSKENKSRAEVLQDK